MNDLRIEHSLGEANIADARAVRWSVFVEEQGVPADLELDGLDIIAEHYTGYIDGSPVVTARTREVAEGIIKIERVAVLSTQQGRGYGQLIVRHILERLDAQEQCGTLEAQTHALTFYQRLGFRAVGSVFMDAGIPHQKMIRDRP